MRDERRDDTADIVAAANERALHEHTRPAHLLLDLPSTRHSEAASDLPPVHQDPSLHKPLVRHRSRSDLSDHSECRLLAKFRAGRRAVPHHANHSRVPIPESRAHFRHRRHQLQSVRDDVRPPSGYRNPGDLLETRLVSRSRPLDSRGGRQCRRAVGDRNRRSVRRRRAQLLLFPETLGSASQRVSRDSQRSRRHQHPFQLCHHFCEQKVGEKRSVLRDTEVSEAGGSDLDADHLLHCRVAISRPRPLFDDRSHVATAQGHDTRLDLPQHCLVGLHGSVRRRFAARPAYSAHQSGRLESKTGHHTHHGAGRDPGGAHEFAERALGVAIYVKCLRGNIGTIKYISTRISN